MKTEQDILNALPPHIVDHQSQSELQMIAKSLFDFEKQSLDLDPVYGPLAFGNKANEIIADASRISFYDVGCMINEWVGDTYIPNTSLSDILRKKQLDPTSLRKPATCKENLSKILSASTSNAVSQQLPGFLLNKGFCVEVITDQIKPLLREHLVNEGLSELSIPKAIQVLQLSDGSLQIALPKKGEIRSIGAIDKGQLALAKQVIEDTMRPIEDEIHVLDEALVFFADDPVLPKKISLDTTLCEMSYNFAKALKLAISEGQKSMHITPEGTLSEGETLHNFKQGDEIYVPHDKLPKDVQDAINVRIKSSAIENLAKKESKAASEIITAYYEDTLTGSGLKSAKATLGYAKPSPTSRTYLDKKKVAALCKEVDKDYSDFESTTPSTTIRLDQKAQHVKDLKAQAEVVFDSLLSNASKPTIPKKLKP